MLVSLQGGDQRERGWGLALVWPVVGLFPVTEVGARLVRVGMCVGVWHGECCFVCEVDIVSLIVGACCVCLC